jgi:pimeloyl-ACP methyl ester carboxylesterase
VPVDEISIIGHSMGGLVSRSACHHAEQQDRGWPTHLRRMVFLGSPHCGAPLETGGQWLDRLLSFSPYSAPIAALGQSRSAGIGDLRTGVVTDDAKGFAPLPNDVDCYAIAAKLSAGQSGLSERLIGDGLVPVDSALGRHEERGLAFPADHCWTANGMGHIELLHRPEVRERLLGWFE